MIEGTFDQANAFERATLRRAAAFVIDLTWVAVLGFVATSVFGVVVVTSGTPPSPLSPEGMHAFGSTTLAAFPITLAIAVGYFLGAEVIAGRTAGKAFFGLRVVRLDLQEPARGQLFVRNLLRAVDLLAWWTVLVMGVIVIASPQRQRLGDYLARTSVVLDADAIDPRRRHRGRTWIVGGVLALMVIAGLCLFDYFGRPPLDIAGMHNQGAFLSAKVTDYRLGAPTFGNQEVTYPVSLHLLDQGACSGSVFLRFSGSVPFGHWVLGGAEYRCEHPPPKPAPVPGTTPSG